MSEVDVWVLLLSVVEKIVRIRLEAKNFHCQISSHKQQTNNKPTRTEKYVADIVKDIVQTRVHIVINVSLLSFEKISYR
jgi:hypothetical protein